MKKIGIFIFSFLAIVQLQAQNGVAFNTSGASPDASAIIDASSTVQGFLIPRMTETQRDAISSPANGLMIYQTDNTPGFYHNAGTPASPSWIANGSTVAIGIDDLTDGKYLKESYYLGLNSGVSPSQLYSEKNVGIGEGSLQNVDWGSGCVAVGYNSLNTMANSYYNTALGAYAGSDVTGNSNTFIGYQAGVVATSAVSNIAIGSEVLNTLSTGDNNIAVTCGAANITSGSSNIVIGPTSTNIADGTADHQMNIGSTIYATGMTTASVKVGIGNGNNAPTSTLDIKGSVTKSIVSKSTAYTATENDYTILVTAATTITLPVASSCTGREYVIRTTGSHTVTLNGGGSNIVNHTQAGASTIKLGEYVIHTGHGHTAANIYINTISVTVQSDGAKWYVIADHSYTDQ